MSNNQFDDRASRSSRDRRFENGTVLIQPVNTVRATSRARLCASVRDVSEQRAGSRSAISNGVAMQVDKCPFVTASSRRYIGLHARTPVAERSAALPPSPAHRPYASGTCFPFVTVQTAARRTVFIVFPNCGVHGPPMDRHGCSRAAYITWHPVCVCNCTTNLLSTPAIGCPIASIDLAYCSCSRSRELAGKATARLHHERAGEE